MILSPSPGRTALGERAAGLDCNLLFRLNTIEIQIPPLRERREGCLMLAGLLLGRHAQRYRRASGFFSPLDWSIARRFRIS